MLAQARARHVDDPEEVYQEYCLAILEGLQPGKTIDQFCIDYIRSIYGRAGVGLYEERKKFIRPTSFHGEIHGKVTHPSGASGHINDINQALSVLTDLEKEAFLLKEYWGGSFNDIAARDGVTNSAVAHRYMIAKDKIRKWRENL